jgi:hypothetical protein
LRPLLTFSAAVPLPSEMFFGCGAMENLYYFLQYLFTNNGLMENYSCFMKPDFKLCCQQAMLMNVSGAG